MAYQTRGRDPLFDRDMAQAIEKRGRELLGLGLIVIGCLIGALIYSYHPDDPSFVSATDAPVQNWLGRTGAALSAPIAMIVGWGGWGLALGAIAWGARFALHKGAERAIGRLIWMPIWIALISVYAATLTPNAGWTHSFSMGGMFGDMVLGLMLTILPIPAGMGVKFAALLLGVLVLAMGFFVLGFDRAERRRIRAFLWVGLVMSYATLMRLMGRSAGGAMTAAAALRARAQERSAAQLALGQNWEVQPWQGDAAPLTAAPAAKPSLLQRMPGMVRRPDAAQADLALPENELIETWSDAEVAAPGEERIREKISDAIRARLRPTPVVSVAANAAAAPPKGPRPLILDTTRRGFGAEPPLTAALRAAPGLSPEPLLTRPRTSDARPDPYAADLDPAFREALPSYDRDEDFAADLSEDAADPFAEDYSSHNMFLEDSDANDTDLDAELPPHMAIPRSAIPVAEPRRAVVQHTPKKPLQPSSRAAAEAQPRLQFDEAASAFELPPLSLLSNPGLIQRHHLSDDALEENARLLEAVLDDYGVKGEIVSVRPGPVVTMYELEPAPGLKASRVIGLADDIARSMSALSARVSTVPGRSVIGIELPNEHREKVVLREIIAAREFGDTTMKLPLALGKDIGGDPVVANLAKMPHLLIAGTTGSGKSVAINTMILSLLYKLTPEDCRLIMIDPKMLELSVYDGIPHLLSPVVTDPKKAVVALKWVVGEMEERYRKMSKMGVRNIDGYNSRVADALAKNEMFSRTVQTGFDEDTGEPIFETEEFQPVKMPYIVVIVDEMADLMMVAGKDIEACIQRLAQMARASGIHLIMATQRPSVDVITGTIKANFPTRISFQVTSKIDSRTILGEMGAEQLLGQGDMLYMAGGAKITRCHGPFVSDEEVEEIVNHLKAFGPPTYVSRVIEGHDDDREADIDAVLGLNTGGNTEGEDALYDQAVAIVVKDRKCSTSYIQRKLGIGYNKAARLVEQMEDQGVVTPANHVGKREILVPEQH